MNGPNIITLLETEELANFGGTLGSETFGVHDIGQAGNLSFALLDDGQGEHRQILADNTTTDGFSFTFTGSAGSVARMTIREEESDTGR